MKRDYGGVIWTNHALSRMEERGIEQGDAWATWRKPQSSKYAKSRGGWVYKRTFGKQELEVVAKKNDKNEWLIISVWSKPVRKVYQHKRPSFNLGFLKKIFG